MSEFERHMFFVDTDGTGISIDQLARALQTWVHMQDREAITVREAMTAFNTTAAVIQEAAMESGAWLFISGPSDEPDKQFLELDGE